MYNGIDISKWNGTPDFNRIKAAGMKFVIIRAGYCYNNGSLEEDPTFRTNIHNAIEAGLDVGVYVFSYALSQAAGRQAAKELIELIAPYQLTYPVVWDIEDSSAVTYSKMSKEENTAISNGFILQIIDAGYYPMIYASTSFLENHLNMKDIQADVWAAQWGAKCTYSGEVGIWQFSESGIVDGISGHVDMNVSYKDYPALILGQGWKDIDEDAEENDYTNDDYEETEAATYTVIKNDNLTKIAKMFGVPLMQLIKFNPQIKNPDLIYVGDVINIPCHSLD